MACASGALTVAPVNSSSHVLPQPIRPGSNAASITERLSEQMEEDELAEASEIYEALGLLCCTSAPQIRDHYTMLSDV